MQYQIKELGVGGILDRAVQLTKNHFGLFFGIVAASYLPFVLLQGFATNAMLPEPPASPSMEDWQVYQEAAGQVMLTLMPLSLLFVFAVIPIANAAVIDAVSRCYLNKPTSVGSSYSHAMKILFPLLGTWILQTLAIMGGFILLIIPGIIFTFWFALSSHAVVIGGESGRAALSRSKKLMSGNIGTFFALSLVLGAIQWGIGISAQVIPQPHISLIANAFLGSIAFVFSTVAFVVFYFSCRCKIENFDLELLAENIGADGPSEADAEPTF